MKREPTLDDGSGNKAAALLGTPEVARLLKVHPKHVYRLLRRGLPAHRLGGEWRYDADEVMQWVRERAGGAEPERPLPGGSSSGDVPAAPPLLAANGDVCVELLVKTVSELCAQTLGVVQADRTSGRRLVTSGQVAAAGVHGDEPGGEDGLLRVHVTRRELGLAFVKRERLRTLSAVSGARLATRASTSGIRAHFDAALRAEGADPEQVQRRAQVHASHRDVVLAILSGKADAGIVSVAWAARAGLACLPFAEEHYDLCLRPEQLSQPAGKALVRALQGRELRRLLTGAAGYDPKDAGRLEL